MISQAQQNALVQTFAQAKAAGVLFPEAQACEVMVETAWGTSGLYLQGNNGFGMKQHSTPIYETITMPTKEFMGGVWITVDAPFVKYPDLASCFADRTATLVRLAPSYPHYAAALAATTPEDFLTEVSLTWSTGPTRGEQCISILHAHGNLLV